MGSVRVIMQRGIRVNDVSVTLKNKAQSVISPVIISRYKGDAYYSESVTNK
jgi:hypothetical protein